VILNQRGGVEYKNVGISQKSINQSINQSIILHEQMSGCQLRIKSRSASQLQPSLLFPIPKALRFISPRSLGAGIRGLFRTEMFHLDVLVR